MNKPEKIFDGLLVLKCQNGDKKAFSLLVKRWHTKLCRQAFWYTKDIDVAQDVVQDSWKVILKKVYNLRDVNNFGAWVSTIVNRKAVDWLRKNKRNQEKLHNYYEKSQVNDDTVTNNVDTNDDSSKAKNTTTEIVLSAIKKLPENQQIILKLFYMEEYSIPEISNILNISKGTVKSRLFYAREKLKSILKHKNHEK